MVRFVSPPLDELYKLEPPISEDERIVLDFFLRNLSEDWEIYIRPHLNGLSPSFTLLNPRVGIAVFELSCNPYAVHYEKENPAMFSTLKPISGKVFEPFVATDNPIYKIEGYGKYVSNFYAPAIGKKRAKDKRFHALITKGVIFTRETTERARDLTKPFINDSQRPHIPISGIDSLQANKIVDVFPSAERKTSQLMSSEIANQLKGWLVESDFYKQQRKPLPLSPEQFKLANDRTKSGYRRIKGSAGSGKSLVLATRAAVLASEGKKVLVVTFNITLWHYLKDLVSRYPAPGVNLHDNVTYLHFHEWCSIVIEMQAGMKSEYRKLFQKACVEKRCEELFKNNPDFENCDKPSKGCIPISKILEKDIVNLAGYAIDRLENNTKYGQPGIEKYDAILVDEGQDYSILWWNTLRRVLKDNGEMLLVADETQDIYDRAKKWTDLQMDGAGFRGDWMHLDICYRSPPNLIEYLRSFTQEFLDVSATNLTSPESKKLDLYPVSLKWVQSSQDALPSLCADAAFNIQKSSLLTPIAYEDIVILLPDHQIGLRVVDALQKKGLECSHIFDLDKQTQKPLKMNFFMGVPHIKACTIHSFKGWESPHIVIGVSDKTDLATVYVAMSRLRDHLEGSHLTVVCSAPNLKSYGETWPDYTNTDSVSESRKHVTVDYTDSLF